MLARYLHVKVSFKSKYQLLIIRKRQVGIQQTKNPKTFTDYSQVVYNVYETLEGNNPTNKNGS